MRYAESKIQIACVSWFRYQHSKYRKCLFAVPNGGARNDITGAILRAEGVLAGVADLLLLVPNRFYGCLAIEMKSAKGRQQKTQKEWQAEVEAAGNKYVICRSLDEFKTAVNDYLNDM